MGTTDDLTLERFLVASALFDAAVVISDHTGFPTNALTDTRTPFNRRLDFYRHLVVFCAHRGVHHQQAKPLAHIIIDVHIAHFLERTTATMRRYRELAQQRADAGDPETARIIRAFDEGLYRGRNVVRPDHMTNRRHLEANERGEPAA